MSARRQTEKHSILLEELYAEEEVGVIQGLELYAEEEVGVIQGLELYAEEEVGAIQGLELHRVASKSLLQTEGEFKVKSFCQALQTIPNLRVQNFQHLCYHQESHQEVQEAHPGEREDDVRVRPDLRRT